MIADVYAVAVVCRMCMPVCVCARFLLWMTPYLLLKPRRYPAYKAAVALAGAYGVKTIASRL